MTERGIVTELKTQNSTVIVRVERKTACAHCGKCPGSTDGVNNFFEVKNLCNAKINDWVVIDMENNQAATATLIMYGIPLAAFLLGTLLSYYTFFANVSYRDGGSFAVGIILIIATYLIIHLNEKRRRFVKFMPSAVQIEN